MSFVAKLYEDDRSTERYHVLLDGTLRNPQAEPQDVVIDDLSANGFRTSAAHGLTVGDVITLGIFGVGLRTAQVQWAGDGHYGCQFVMPLSIEELNFALVGLTPPDPIRFPASELGTAATVNRPAKREWSLSPRMRVLSLAIAGFMPWIVVGLLWRAF